MLSKKKKIIILSTMLLLLIITGYLNLTLNDSTIQTGGNVTTASFFTTYKNDRQSTRDREIEYYDAIIASSSSSQEAKTVAEKARASLIEAMDKELVVEGLIKAKGYEDVIITTTTTSVNVIIKSSELTSTNVAQIVEVVKNQLDTSLDNIRIIPIE